jgi:uncharacterized protein (DUF433 family)
MSDDELIARYIELDPRRPWPGDAWLRDSGVHVWALVGHWRLARAQDVTAVACDYDLPVEAVQAALAYYRRHTAAIDARLAENAPVEVA